jgi:hypothetical protein
MLKEGLKVPRDLGRRDLMQWWDGYLYYTEETWKGNF